MPISDKETWKKWEDNNNDDYGGACVAVARRVMEILDEEPGPFTAHSLVRRANNEAETGGITGYMAGAVATMVSGCHSRGEEFRKSWNGDYDHEGDGVVNPAILTIG